MAAILTPRVVRRVAGECTDVDEFGAVGIRLEPAAAIDENQDGTRGSNLLCSSGESHEVCCCGFKRCSRCEATMSTGWGRRLSLRVFGCLPVTARGAARRQASEKPRRRKPPGGSMRRRQ